MPATAAVAVVKCIVSIRPAAARPYIPYIPYIPIFQWPKVVALDIYLLWFVANTPYIYIIYVWYTWTRRVLHIRYYTVMRFLFCYNILFCSLHSRTLLLLHILCVVYVFIASCARVCVIFYNIFMYIFAGVYARSRLHTHTHKRVKYYKLSRPPVLLRCI